MGLNPLKQQHPANARTEEQKRLDDEAQEQQFPSGPPGPSDHLWTVHEHVRAVKARLRARHEPSSQ